MENRKLISAKFVEKRAWGAQSKTTLRQTIWKVLSFLAISVRKFSGAEITYVDMCKSIIKTR